MFTRCVDTRTPRGCIFITNVDPSSHADVSGGLSVNSEEEQTVDGFPAPAEWLGLRGGE
jgi:hypothetical protein